MASLAELARDHTDLTLSEIDHLQRLVASWGLLADLCFSDLLLFGGPTASSSGTDLVVLGQIRPTTSQTLFRQDWVGRRVSASERPLVERALRDGIVGEGVVVGDEPESRVRELCIPVSFAGRVIAVLARESAPTSGRQPGELERTYVAIFDRFAWMISAGEFPFGGEEGPNEQAPRVGDGALVLDGQMRVTYASPNAVSALHRVGVHANSEGRRLGELGLPETAIRMAFARGRPATEEIEHDFEFTVTMRLIPLLDEKGVSGALVLLRDISELRRRDLLLLSKDATIREIHHRVKNNLQTISSLLRLQGRRLSSAEAKAAIDESVRRIRTIAMVHETLSHAAGDDVPFVEIVRPLVRMVEEGLASPERPLRVSVTGDGGVLPTSVATSVSLVLVELLQNAVDHAYTGGDFAEVGVTVELGNDGERVTLMVIDDGVGTPDEFDLDSSAGLGLSIVRTLVTSELRGTISYSGSGGPVGRRGTTVRISIPLR